MGLLNRTSRGPIGIDVGSRWIKAAQISGHGSRARLQGAALLPRASTDAVPSKAEIAQLADVLDRQGFTGRRIVLAPPPTSLLTATVTLPPRGSGAPLEQIARMELARVHRCEPQQLSLAFWELPQAASAGGKPAEGMGALAVACSGEQANPLLDAFESAGFDVVGLDVQWLALRRACAPLLAETGNAVTAILDLGAGSARIVAMQQGVIVYERLLGESGIGRIGDQLRTKLNLDDDAIEYLLKEVGLADGDAAAAADEAPTSERRQARRERGSDNDLYKEPRRIMTEALDALAEEVATSLAYVVQQYRGGEVTAVLLTGGGAGIPGAAEHLAGALQTHVRAVRPAELAQVPGPLMKQGTNPAFVAALGLAMYRV